MTFAGTGTTANLLAGLRPDFDDIVRILTSTETPLQSGTVGSGQFVLPTGIATAKRIDWEEDVLLSGRTSLKSALATTTATDVVLATGTRGHFGTGDVIVIGNEQMNVTGYSSAADTIVVTRGFNSTAAATAAAAAVVRSVGRASTEGSDAENARLIDRTNPYNFTQIFRNELVLSGTRQAVDNWQNMGEMDYQLKKKLVEHSIMREVALVKGIRGESAGVRTLGGLDQFTTGVNDQSTTTLTETILTNALRTIMENGADPGTLVIMASPKQRQVIAGFSTFGTIQVQRADAARGTSVTSFVSDFGQGDVVTNRHLTANELYIFSRENVMLKTLRPITVEPLAKTGDADKWQIISEITLQMAKGSQAARFSALT